MKKILLTKNKFALVDDEDFAWLTQWKWHISSNGYAHRTINSNKKISIHRQILGIQNTPFEGDHLNHNKLDNQRSNLRIATRSENLLNRNIYKNNKSGFVGVSWKKSIGKWRAVFQRKHLGYFDTKEKARQVYILAFQRI